MMQYPYPYELQTRVCNDDLVLSKSDVRFHLQVVDRGMSSSRHLYVEFIMPRVCYIERKNHVV